MNLIIDKWRMISDTDSQTVNHKDAKEGGPRPDFRSVLPAARHPMLSALTGPGKQNRQHYSYFSPRDTRIYMYSL